MTGTNRRMTRAAWGITRQTRIIRAVHSSWMVSNGPGAVGTLLPNNASQFVQPYYFPNQPQNRPAFSFTGIADGNSTRPARLDLEQPGNRQAPISKKHRHERVSALLRIHLFLRLAPERTGVHVQRISAASFRPTTSSARTRAAHRSVSPTRSTRRICSMSKRISRPRIPRVTITRRWPMHSARAV